ncbi:L,D-transpeptidase [Rhodovulum sp. YNF3179]|uniref:L,D-transpeptidase n=1 Tax=Rhodovulum sp. YNF3179 TaxID=3425127 RepID=UPI003D342069
MLTRRTMLAGAAASISSIALADEAMIDIENMLPGDFTWHPERSPQGAVAVIASIPEQRVHVYRNGVRIAVSTCSTGKPGHETPTGVFTVLQKDADHRSSTYGGAPMPNMNRLTWDGIALHAGNLPGYPASHGCVRLPLEFSRRLFTVTHVGTPVILSGAHNDPWDLIHPGLVLHAFAEQELEIAVSGLETRSHPADWTNEQPYPVTTVLATAADRRIVVMEDGREVMEDEIGLVEDGPLGEHVLVLQRRRGKGLGWMGVTHHADPLHPLWPEEQVLNRLRLSSAANRHLAERLHPGMTFVVSDLAATPDRRSGHDFVIMTGDDLVSPRPRARP